MFGKTRLGKSNVVKLIAQGMIDTTGTDNNVGQLIFDINGEYANDNPQDGNVSIRSKNDSRCQVYALVERPNTLSKPLRLNFYEQPDSCFNVIRSMLARDKRASIYVQSFANVTMPSLASIADLPNAEKTRPVRRIQMYWAILHKAGFTADEQKLRGLGLAAPQAKDFDPHFHPKARSQVYQTIAEKDPPGSPNSLDQLLAELEMFAQYIKQEGGSGLTSSSDKKKPLFEPDDLALLDFLAPAGGRAGPIILRAYLAYHDSNAGDFIADILKLLDAGCGCIDARLRPPRGPADAGASQSLWTEDKLGREGLPEARPWHCDGVERPDWQLPRPA